MKPASEPVDERAQRLTQTTVAVVLLGAFVFGAPLVVVAVLVATGIGAAAGPHANPLVAGYTAVARKLSFRAGGRVDGDSAHQLDLLATALVAPALLGFVVGIDSVAWVLTLLEAAVAAVAASTGVNAAALILARFRR